MIKWLKDRQNGNAVNKKKIYENISIGPKFAYRGVFDCGSQDGQRDKMLSHLKWTSDGHYLISLDEEFDVEDDEDEHSLHSITIWENPNCHTKQRVKSKIDLEKNGISPNAYFCSMECHNSNVILGGCWEDDLADINNMDNHIMDIEGVTDLGGVIYLISLLTGEVNEIIRNAIFEKTSTVFKGVASFFFRKWSFSITVFKELRIVSHALKLFPILICLGCQETQKYFMSICEKIKRK